MWRSRFSKRLKVAVVVGISLNSCSSFTCGGRFQKWFLLCHKICFFMNALLMGCTVLEIIDWTNFKVGWFRYWRKYQCAHLILFLLNSRILIRELYSLILCCRIIFVWKYIALNILIMVMHTLGVPNHMSMYFTQENSTMVEGELRSFSYVCIYTTFTS